MQSFNKESLFLSHRPVSWSRLPGCPAAQVHPGPRMMKELHVLNTCLPKLLLFFSSQWREGGSGKEHIRFIKLYTHPLCHIPLERAHVACLAAREAGKCSLWLEH